VKRAVCLLLSLLLTGACGCSRVQGRSSTGAWYLRDTESGPRWEERGFVPAAGSLADQCAAVLAALQKPPEGLRAALPATVRVLSVRVTGNVVYVDFSAEYAALGTLERSAACAAAVHSLLRLKGLLYVSVTAEGMSQSPLYERYCTADTFVMS